MLETYTFVGMLATMQPPQQWVPEDSSPEKVVTNFKLRIYLTPLMLRMCIAIRATPHTQSQHAGLLGKKISFYSFLHLQLLHCLVFITVFVIISVTSYLRHRLNKIKSYFVISCLLKTR
jgi:hypothetical protein